MRKQQQIWESEHASRRTLPTMAKVEPSSGVVSFVDYLREKFGIRSGRAIDIGAGKGRNSVYLAEQGFTVDGLEYVKMAVDTSVALAKDRGVADRVHFRLAEIDSLWPFADETFDIAIDSFSSIDIETKQGRETCRDEMLRTLKQGGFALVNVCSANDEWEREMIARYPGSEPNSCIWPQNGKFQKDYDEPELQEFYQDFDIIALDTVNKPAYKLGREGTATNIWLVLQKRK